MEHRIKNIPKATIAKGDDGQLYLKNFYTPLSVAKKEIWRRWNDEKLKKKVEYLLGKEIKKYFNGKPKSFFARQVMSPNFETIRFVNLSKKANLQPLCLEYTEDNFNPSSSDKYFLAKMFFYGGKGKNGGKKLSAMNIIDFDKCDSKKFCDMTTNTNKNFVDFHHDLLHSTIPGSNKMHIDLSPYVKKAEKNEYKKIVYLTLSVAHGILFENFLLDDSVVSRKEIDFTNNRILPLFNNLTKKFGVKPLISNLDPLENECDLCWWSYPEEVGEMIKK